MILLLAEWIRARHPSDRFINTGILRSEQIRRIALPERKHKRCLFPRLLQQPSIIHSIEL